MGLDDDGANDSTPALAEPSPRRRRRWPWIVVASVVLVAAIVLGFGQWVARGPFDVSGVAIGPDGTIYVRGSYERWHGIGSPWVAHSGGQLRAISADGSVRIVAGSGRDGDPSNAPAPDSPLGFSGSVAVRPDGSILTDARCQFLAVRGDSPLVPVTGALGSGVPRDGARATDVSLCHLSEVPPAVTSDGALVIKDDDDGTGIWRVGTDGLVRELFDPERAGLATTEAVRWDVIGAAGDDVYLSRLSSSEARHMFEWLLLRVHPDGSFDQVASPIDPVLVAPDGTVYGRVSDGSDARLQRFRWAPGATTSSSPEPVVGTEGNLGRGLFDNPIAAGADGTVVFWRPDEGLVRVHEGTRSTIDIG